MMHVVYVQPVRREQDLVRARQVARELAGLLGYDAQWQTRIATAVSEITRNAWRYASGGDVEFSVETAPPQSLRIRIVDAGPGIPHVDDVLLGRYRSPTGMGMGIVGTKRLVDEFRIETAPGRGTEVFLAQALPRAPAPLTADDCDRIAHTLAAAAANDPYEEVQRQNRELLATLDELRRRQAELDRLNAELEDTNRGVMALYAELDDKAESLKRASEAKTRFLSNMTHEFRTPLNSVLSLSHMLIDRTDGDLTSEQERQVAYIRKSAEDLATLVDDLLDLAKVEAGKIDVRPTEFEASELFGGLKGVLRPLLASSSVVLHFDEPVGVPTLYTDEGKLSQILRNLISNALKYTEAGEVRVRADYDPAGVVTFSVRDTGIGIAAEDRERIFEEFTQVEGPAQRRAKGTGLGLPLSRKLAELLGGRLELESEVGVGSLFSVTVPARFEGAPASGTARRPEAVVPSVLALDESAETLAAYEASFTRFGFRLTPARTLAEARATLARLRPAAVVMDVLLGGEGAWALLEELKSSAATRDVPVVVATCVENRDKAIAAGADEFALKPVDPAWLAARVDALVRSPAPPHVLVIDDDEVARYLLRDLLGGTRCVLLEAASAAEGLRAVREERPDAVFLDLVMPEMSGEEALAALAAGEDTRDVPVIIYTSESVEDARRAALMEHAVAVVGKRAPSRDAAAAEIRAALALAGVDLGEVRKEVKRG